MFVVGKIGSVSREGRIEKKQSDSTRACRQHATTAIYYGMFAARNTAMTARHLRHENPNVVKTQQTDAREIMHVDLIGAGGGSLIGGGCLCRRRH